MATERRLHSCPAMNRALEMVPRPGWTAPTPSAADRELGERIALALRRRDDLVDTVLLGCYRVDERTRGDELRDWYAGTDVDADTSVEIEVMSASAAADPEACASFELTAHALCELEHRHLIKTLDWGRTPDGRPFAVRENPPCEPLVQLLARNGRLSWTRIRTIALQLCSAVAKVRDRGWTAQDLSVVGCRRIRNLRTLDDVRLGTLVRLDALESHEADERNDVFALGRIVAYLAHGGATPRPGGGKVPIELADVLARATAAAPEQRYPSVMQLGRALAALGRGGTTWSRKGSIAIAGTIDDTSPAAAPAQVPPARRGRVALTALLVAGATLAGVQLADPGAIDRAWHGAGELAHDYAARLRRLDPTGLAGDVSPTP